MQALLHWRRQLVNQRVQELNRLDRGWNAVARASTQRHIALLDEEIDRLDEEYRKALQSSAVLTQQAKLYRSVPGVGDKLLLQLHALDRQSRYCFLKPKSTKPLTSNTDTPAKVVDAPLACGNLREGQRNGPTLLDEHTHVPLATAADLDVGWVALGPVGAGVGQDDQLTVAS